MKYALINPNWTFEGSIYFGCREPHLPLEFGYSKALLEQAGHEVCLIDGQLEDLSLEEIRRRVAAFQPDITVDHYRAELPVLALCSARTAGTPSDGSRPTGCRRNCMVAVGPHASTTPKTTLRKLGVQCRRDGRMRGDPAAVGRTLGPGAVDLLPRQWRALDTGRNPRERHVALYRRSLAGRLCRKASRITITGSRHNRKDLAAEVETSRGCPYHCTFCAKDNFRDKYRRRPVNIVLEEIDGLLRARC